MDPCFVTPVGANWQAVGYRHQVTTGILLVDALGDAKRHYLSGWTETTWRSACSGYRHHRTPPTSLIKVAPAAVRWNPQGSCPLHPEIKPKEDLQHDEDRSCRVGSRSGADCSARHSGQGSR